VTNIHHLFLFLYLLMTYFGTCFLYVLVINICHMFLIYIYIYIYIYTHDITSYDILIMFLVLFLCIWGQIRLELEELSMVWGTYYIVFTQVVVIQFYPRSCKSICVLSVFYSEESYKSSNQDIMWRIKDK